jgi:hypothetical protein
VEPRHQSSVTIRRQAQLSDPGASFSRRVIFQLRRRFHAEDAKESPAGVDAAQDKKLRQLARGNTPTPVIGVKLGRTEDAVRNHASEIGRSLKPTNQSPYGTGGKKRK